MEDFAEQIFNDLDAELFAGEPVTVHPSSSGNYLSVTVTIEAASKAQLDRIYQDLTDCEQVLVAL